MKVFLDVGAHTGETLAAVKAMDFDRIVCFEPAAGCWPALEKLAGAVPLVKGAQRKVSIEKFGLWNQTCPAPIFQPGTQGGGMWKKDRGLIDETAVCRFVRASTWFRDNIKADDQVFLKLNCEGAECDILDDLLDAGEFYKVAHVMIDFDVRKIAALKHRESEIRDRLTAFPFPRVAFSKDVMRGETHVDRIRNWLRLVNA